MVRFWKDVSGMDASASVSPGALLMDAVLRCIIVFFWRSVRCQYELANRLWLTGDCVG